MVLTWGQIADALFMAENPGVRITSVQVTCDAPEWFDGDYGRAPVTKGNSNCYQMNTGEVVAL